MLKHFRGAFSWLGIGPDAKKQRSVPLTGWEKTQLDHDRITIHDSLLNFNSKIEKYNALCKKYEETAGTERGTLLLRQMEILREDIEKSSKKVTKLLDETVTLTHHRIQS